MGSGSGSAGNPEQATGQGRHRRDEAASAWPTRQATKALTRKTPGRHSRPEVGPSAGADRGTDRQPADTAEPEQDEPLDTGPVGLRMFNLGSIPASVTPPRSWRRAAWFTVVSSVAALAGLLAIGAALVCPHENRRLLAVPYFPDGTPLASIGGSAGTPRPTTGGHHPVTTTAAGNAVVDMGDTAPLATGRHRATDSSQPATSAPVVVTLPPTVPTVAGSEPVVDPVQLIKRTQTFFKEVTSNAKAAADLTTSTLHDDAVALIHRKYGDISAVKVQSISLDPNSGLTISVLRVVNKDGSTATQTTSLQFTLTGDPKIVNVGNR